jgi:hypothetical protein
MEILKVHDISIKKEKAAKGDPQNRPKKSIGQVSLCQIFYLGFFCCQIEEV